MNPTPALIESIANDIERDFRTGDKMEARYTVFGQAFPALHVSLYYSKGGTHYGPSRRGFYLSVCPYSEGRYHVSEGAQMFISPAEITRVSKKAEREARAELVTHNLYGLLENVLAQATPTPLPSRAVSTDCPTPPPIPRN